MWHWQNNGPRPPYSNRQLLTVLFIAWGARIIIYTFRDAFLNMYEAVVELQRRHPGW
jgi:hypothetical protein